MPSIEFSVAPRQYEAGRLGGWLLIAAFFVVALIFALSFGTHGYVPTDQGFVLAQSWRVHGGQVPYRDFLYVRPPGSIYLHALWFALPAEWVVRAARFAYYGQLAVAGLVPALVALRAGLIASPTRLALLSVSFYVIALHNFPPMPWYTVDGVFFASLALGALLASQRAGSDRASVGWRALASVLAGLAVTMKQNYAVLPLLMVVADSALVTIAFTRGEPVARKRQLLLRLGASVLPMALVLGLLAVGLSAAGAWTPFLDQVGGAGSVRKLMNVGILPWLEPSSIGAFAIGAAVVSLAWRSTASERWSLAEVATLAVPVLLVAAVWDLEMWRQTDNRAGHWLVTAIAGGVLARLLATRAKKRNDRQRLLLEVGVLAIAWCASVSLGASSPLLGLALGGVAVELLLPPVHRRGVPALVLLASFALCAGLLVVRVWNLNAEQPYRLLPRTEQTSALHETFPRFGELYTGPPIGERMRELRKLVETHALEPGRDFTVVPGYPLIHFLVDRQTRAPMDWYVIFDLLMLRADVARRLEHFDGVIVLQRSASMKPCSEESFSRQHRRLSRRLLESGRLLESSRHFCVVEPRRSGRASAVPR